MQMHSSKNKRISRLFHIRKIVSNLKSIDRSLVKKYTRYLITIVGCVGAYMIGLGLDSKLASFHTDPEKDAIELVLRGTVEQQNVLCDHEREDFPCDDFEARAPASSKSVRPLHITLAHTNASLSTLHVSRHERVSVLDARAHRIAYTPLKTRNGASAVCLERRIWNWKIRLIARILAQGQYDLLFSLLFPLRPLLLAFLSFFFSSSSLPLPLSSTKNKRDRFVSFRFVWKAERGEVNVRWEE